MPLILMTGYPSSGKSTRAIELKNYLESRLQQPENQGRPLTVHIIDDHSLGFTHAAYASPRDEKNLRSALLSAVERLVTKTAIVIADAPNYIKGLRYQLYCIAREVATTHCLVHCAISADGAREINQGRGEDAYDPGLFDELIMRYEDPNPAARWDSPLFTLVQHERDALPGDAIWDALVERKALAPNFATAVKPVAETNYLFELDRVTQDVVASVLDAQKSGVPMSEVVVGSKRVSLPGRCLTLSEMRRLRMQFTKLNKQVPLKVEAISDAFVDYLNINL
ncbi:kti12, chromatin associated [Coemansia sp. RSA 2703]|nr:kti12, chromatin associated [Coemansia sp. RSA 2703]KAJ2379561.1 kti12, chromatin associated [Coemansia sp. RSA 2607]KAJ2398407.1 kti12, chromatin associated [Coemansia sp. RSA 2603]